MCSPGRRLTLALLFALGAAGAAAAGDWVYWIRKGEIGRLAADGSSSETIVDGSSTITSIAYDPETQEVFWGDMHTGKLWRGEAMGGLRTPLVEGRGLPKELELSRQWLFWLDSEHGLRRLSRAGGEPETIVAKERYDGPAALAVAGDRLYWTDSRDRWLRRAAFDGSAVEKLVELDRQRVDEIEILGERVWWLSDHGEVLWRATLDGALAEPLVELEGRERLGALEIAGDSLYWILGRGPEDPVIQRADLDGAGAVTLELPILDKPFLALAVAGSRVYWGESHTGRVVGAGLDGSAPRVLIDKRVADPTGIVVLGDQIYWSQEALGYTRPGLIRACQRDGGVVRILHGVSLKREPIALATLGGRLFWIERAWLSGTTSRLVGADPLEEDPELEVLVDGLESPTGLAAHDGWLYWLQSDGVIHRVRPDGSKRQRVRALPAEYRDKRLGYQSLAVDGQGFYAGETRQDAVYRSVGRGGREILANDLYLRSLFAHGGQLYWSGVEGFGRIDLATAAVETSSDLRLVEALFVATEP